MRILVIEDDPSLARLIAKTLESECFAVDAISDGTAGSSLARLNEYDLVILGEATTGNGSTGTCAEVRAHGKAMPILIVSANDDPEHKARMLDGGADDYLVKPFALAEFSARIRALLRRPPAAPGDELRVADLTLSTRSGMVCRGARDIRLTRKEFMLLEYLMRNAGAVLSRSMIMEHVWDMSIDLFSNTIESHIRSVRQKIGDTDRMRLIETIVGRGYRMRAAGA